VGGVSERAGAEAGGRNPSAKHSSACRGGRRHPGFPDGGVLRGASSKRRPRSVRRPSWVPPAKASRRRQRMSEGRRGGERRRACATKLMHPTQARVIVACVRADASFARSFDSCSSILTTHGGVKSVDRGGAVDTASRLGKPAQAGGTFTGAVRTDVARLTACRRSRKGEGAVRQKRKEVEASVPVRV